MATMPKCDCSLHGGMFGVRGLQPRAVTCVACGATRAREEAREYDKHGDRWDRDGKSFEYLCKTCHAQLCHQPRDHLEAVLVAAGAGEGDRAGFHARYWRAVEERTS